MSGKIIFTATVKQKRQTYRKSVASGSLLSIFVCCAYDNARTQDAQHRTSGDDEVPTTPEALLNGHNFLLSSDEW